MTANGRPQVASEDRSEQRRVLIITTNYGPGVRASPISVDLTACLASRGCAVDVLAVDWTGQPGTGARHYVEDSGVRVALSFPLQWRGVGRTLGLLSKWVLSSIRALRFGRKAMLRDRYDLVIAFSPAVAMTAPILWATRHCAASYIYIVDFFPFHHSSLGLLPGGMSLKLAFRAENALLRRFDTIGCMSPMGQLYLRDNYRLREGQRTEVLPLWSAQHPLEPVDRAEVRGGYQLPVDRPIAVFGGQIVPGRGIEEILEAARLAAESFPELLFLIVGQGSLSHLVETYIASGRHNVLLLGNQPREQFLRLLSVCDAGIVATVADVDAPTFPSKTIDYLRARLPIVASVEAQTDYGAFVEEQGFGVAIHAGDAVRLLDAIRGVMLDDTARARMVEAGQQALVRTFDVEVAADHFLALAANRAA